MKRIKILGFVLSLFTTAAAQDIHFSQFELAPMLLNPATTGAYHGNGRAIINYRNQWGMIGESYNTMSAAFDMAILRKMKPAYLGVGGYFFKDVAGTSSFGNVQGTISIAGIVPVSEHAILSAGIQGGLGQYSADLSKVTWGNQYNGNGFDTDIHSGEQNSYASNMFGDFSAGVYYELDNSKSSFIASSVTDMRFGVAVFHLNRPENTVLFSDRTPMKFVAHGSMEKSFSNGKYAVIPSLFYAMQGVHDELNFGALAKLHFGHSTKYSGLFKESNLLFGAHYRWNDAFIGEVYFEFTDYMIGVSYDFNTSDFNEATSGVGGFEISLRYTNHTKALQAKSFK